MYTMYNLIDPTMARSTMIRKQLYITREQERALKERARREGISEAELVREALDRHLRSEGVPPVPDHRRRTLEALLATNEELARHLSFPAGYTFNREELYAERENRWFNPREEA